MVQSLYTRLVSVWLAILVLTNCFRSIQNGLLLAAVFFAKRVPDDTWRRHIESLVSIGSDEPQVICLSVYKIFFSTVLIILVILLAREKRWAFPFLRWALILDVFALVVLVIVYGHLGFAKPDMAPLGSQAIYAIAVEVPAIVVLGLSRTGLTRESTPRPEDRKDKENR